MTDINDVFQQVLKENLELQALFPTQANYRYWHGRDEKHKKDRYFHTTEKINHKDKLRYVAGIYRYLKLKKQYKLIVTRGFAKKKKAKARAWKWCEQSR